MKANIDLLCEKKNIVIENVRAAVVINLSLKLIQLNLKNHC